MTRVNSKPLTMLAHGGEIKLKSILIIGGAGYIGTHTLKENSQMEENSQLLIVNSSSESLKRVEKIIGKSIVFIDGDIRDKQKLQETSQNLNGYNNG